MLAVTDEATRERRANVATAEDQPHPESLPRSGIAGYACGVRSLALLCVLAACGGGPRPVPDDLDDPLVARAETERALYTLWWSGARIGDVEEEVRRGPDEVKLVRREHVQVVRGDRLTATRMTVTIHADAELRARDVTVEAWGEAGATTSRATRDTAGKWRIEIDGEPPRTEDGDAVPGELVPYLVARTGSYFGPVLLSGRGFATARLTVMKQDDVYVAELAVPGGTLATRLELDADGSVLRAAGADGVVAVRANASDVAAPYDPPEVVDGTAITLRGAVEDGAAILRLAMAPVTRELPPALPGQAVAADRDRWGIVLDPTLAGALPAGDGTADRTDDIVELVHTVDTRLEDDLAVTAPTMAAARLATAGDCTTHALLFMALASDAKIEAQLVTGFRVDAGRMVRHRWAVAWTGAAWMSVDPTYGQAPASSFLLGLAVHGARAEEVALADEVTFAGTGAANAKVQAAPN